MNVLPKIYLKCLFHLEGGGGPGFPPKNNKKQKNSKRKRCYSFKVLFGMHNFGPPPTFCPSCLSKKILGTPLFVPHFQNLPNTVPCLTSKVSSSFAVIRSLIFPLYTQQALFHVHNKTLYKILRVQVGKQKCIRF